MLPVNSLTIDVEDWHQLAHRKLLGRSVPASRRVVLHTELVLDILAQHKVKATFFVVGAVAEQFPELVRKINGEGHEVATHGFAHRPIDRMGPEEFGGDLRSSIRILEDITGEPVRGHRAAEFSLDGASTWAFETMAAEGLRYDSSVFPIWHPRYGVVAAPRRPHTLNTRSGTLVEFPLATVRLLGQNLPIAGGGYLRVLPLPLIRWSIKALNRHGQMAVLYVHSYDFDKERLELPVPAPSPPKWVSLRWRALKRNWARGQATQAKLEALLRDFSFAPLCEALEVYEAEQNRKDQDPPVTLSPRR